MGARAHTSTGSAGTAPVKRSALGPSGRPAGDRAPPPTLNQQSPEGGKPLGTNTTTSALDTGRLHR